MKVWVVWTADRDDAQLVGVCSNREEAEAWAQVAGEAVEFELRDAAPPLRQMLDKRAYLSPTGEFLGDGPHESLFDSRDENAPGVREGYTYRRVEERPFDSPHYPGRQGQAFISAEGVDHPAVRRAFDHHVEQAREELAQGKWGLSYE